MERHNIFVEFTEAFPSFRMNFETFYDCLFNECETETGVEIRTWTNTKSKKIINANNKTYVLVKSAKNYSALTCKNIALSNSYTFLKDRIQDLPSYMNFSDYKKIMGQYYINNADLNHMHYEVFSDESSDT